MKFDVNNFDECVFKEIREYYKLFDVLYKDISKAKEIENEWFLKEKIEKIYVLIEVENKEETLDLRLLSADQYSSDFEEVEDEFLQHHARKCDECNKYMEEGYVIDDGSSYYCKDSCLYKECFKNDEEYETAYEDGWAYWTTFFE